MPRFYSVDVSRGRALDLIRPPLESAGGPAAATARRGSSVIRPHLFQPLLARVKEDDPQIAIHPDELNAGEQRFVRHLASYLASRPEALAGVDVFLLRNRAKVGIGFYENVNYYPDFVLWLVKDGVQHLLFADPKGLQFIKGKNDEKLTLATRIHEHEAQINAAGPETPVTLDAALISIHAPEKMSQPGLNGLPSRTCGAGYLLPEKERDRGRGYGVYLRDCREDARTHPAWTVGGKEPTWVIEQPVEETERGKKRPVPVRRHPI